ncbi:MAG: hypothetical protein IKX57_05745 [Oscillospiraceae bacterium]|nr:hypothetical protein [Oscillospiraceae bacterium]
MMGKRVIVKECPFCGGTDLVKGWQYGSGKLFADGCLVQGGQEIYHIVCKDCGSIVRSYVHYPEKLK